MPANCRHRPPVLVHVKRSWYLRKVRCGCCTYMLHDIQPYASGVVRYDDYGWILSGFPIVKDLQAQCQAACCPLSACNVCHYSDDSLPPLRIRSLDRCLWPTLWWSSSCMIVILALISRPTKQFQKTSAHYYHFYTSPQCYLSNLRWRRNTWWRICSGVVSQIRKLIITARKLENILYSHHST